MQKVVTSLMFTGRAEEALNFYTSLLPDSSLVSMKKNPDGSVMHATFTLAGQTFMAIDSPPVHDFTFTSSMSLYVTCSSLSEIDTLFARLTEGGSVQMPLQAYPFSQRFAWVTDRFGVAWQLNLA